MADGRSVTALSRAASSQPGAVIEDKERISEHIWPALQEIMSVN